MSLRQAARKTTSAGAAGSPAAQSSNIAQVLERLIATLNRIESKLDKLEN